MKKFKSPPAIPVCTTMVLCDKVIVGEDKTATVVRIIDTIGVPADKKRKNGDLIGIGGVTLFIMLKRGSADAKEFVVHVDCLDPKGRRSQIGQLTFKAEGEPQSGINTKAPLAVRWTGEGNYWYELRLENGMVIARTPFKLAVRTEKQMEQILKAQIDLVEKAHKKGGGEVQ